ncbi:MAG TPA: peptidase S10 [Terriglobia bacterium]|nr:peptidase S10 [Terriglobia bacterium]
MRHARFIIILLALALMPSVAARVLRSQEPDEEAAETESSTSAERARPQPSGKEKPAAEQKGKEKEAPEEKPVVTHHEIHVEGKVLKYTATAGTLPIKNDDGETEANIFFIAYTLDNPNAGKSDSSDWTRRRPLMFSFNGGPGAASVWLHLGCIGPKRVKMQAEGEMPAPPFQLVDNDYTWLDQTDLVFIDPVGTGYSRAAKKELGKKFWGVKGDIESVGEFVRLYLTRYERWASPLFLVGESYGTTRAAGLSGYLLEKGIAFNGILLVSTVLNFETLEFTRGNDLPYILYLPSYTTTAWFHHKLPPDLEQQDLQKSIREVERWASTDYAVALAKGDQLTPDERQAVIDHLARYTGLSKTYIDLADLRIKQWDFCKELLRDQRRTVGRIDSRFKGIDASGVSEAPDYDPSIAAIRPPYTAMFNNYVRAELGYKSDKEYYVLGGGFRQWDWGSAGQGFPDVTPALHDALVQNPYMKLFVASGHFDLATPFFATQYTLDHLGLDPSLRGNISTGEYDAGHMMYIRAESLARLKHDVSGFVANALK